MAELRDTVRGTSLDKTVELVERAVTHFAADDFASSALLAEEAKAMASRSGRVRELLGLSYYRSGRWQDAARELLTFRRLTVSQEQNHVIADCYRALGRPDRSLEICDEVTKDQVEPEIWSEITIVAASALADKGELSEALARLGRADLQPKSVEPRHLRLWYVRADLLERSGRSSEAKRVWESIYAEDPDFFDVSDRLETG